MSLLESLLETLFPPSPEPIRFLRERLGHRVTIRGRVVPRDLIDSPLGGERCVYYRSLLEEWRKTTVLPGDAGYWATAWRDEAICEFYVDDGTGRALVLPERARVIGPGELRRVEAAPGQRGAELTLHPGQQVEVHGVVSEVDDVLDEQRGYREDATRLVLAAPASGWLLVKLR